MLNSGHVTCHLNSLQKIFLASYEIDVMREPATTQGFEESDKHWFIQSMEHSVRYRLASWYKLFWVFELHELIKSAKAHARFST